MRGLVFVGGIVTGNLWLNDGKENSRNFRQGNRVYDSEGIATALSANSVGGLGGETSLYLVEENKRKEDENLTNKQTTIFEYLGNEENTEQKPFKYISLFAGIGGFDFGLNAVGGECVFASEIDKFAKQAYTTLHGLEPHGDITKIDAEDVPDHDVIAAGFPCQSFSLSGKRGGFEDARGTLFFEVARIASEKKPKVLLLENVKGLVGHPSKVDFEGALEEHLIRGNLLWPNEQSTKNTSSIAKKNAESYLRMILQESWELQPNKSTTSLKNTADSAIEVGETYLKYGLTMKLKSLVEQILQITKKYNSCLEGQTQQFVCNVEDLALSLRKLYSTEDSNLEDMFTSEKTMGTLRDLEKSFKNILEENLVKGKSSTTLTESKVMTDLRICMYAVIQLNIIRFIVKGSTLLESLSKRGLFISTEKKENTYTIPTLDIIVKTLNEIGYRVDFEVLNSKYFGVPQNRERIFIVAIREDLVANEPWNIVGNTVVPKGKRRISGYEDVKTFNFDWPTNNTVERRLKDVLETNVDEKFYLSEEKTAQLVLQLEEREDLGIKETEPNKIAGIYGARQAGSVWDKDGLSPTLKTNSGGYSEPIITENTGVNLSKQATEVASIVNVSGTLMARDYKGFGNQEMTGVVEGLPIREATKKGYAVASEGDAVNISFPTSKTRRGRVGKDGQAQTLEASGVNQGVVTPKLRIRKLTPKECWRLQGFTDEQHDAVEAAGISNSQRYKMAGNAVTVNVIVALGERLLPYL